MNLMAPKKKEPEPVEEDDAPKRYPSRVNTRYVGLPLSVWEELKAIADEQDRSTSWMARQAVKEFLARRRSKPTD